MKLNILNHFHNRGRLSSSIVTMFSLRNEKLLRKVLHKYVWKLISLSTGKTHIAPRLRRFNAFATLIFKNFKNHGALMTIKWLKASHLAVQRKLSSVPAPSLRDIEPNLPLPRLINGLPTFIGPMDRKQIRLGHAPTIRLWLSILSVYRILEGPLTPKLNTITDPFEGCHETIKRVNSVSRDIISFNLMSKGWRFDSSRLKADVIQKILTAGPNNPVSIQSVLTDCLAFKNFPETLEAFKLYDLATSSSLYESLEDTMNGGWEMISKIGDDWLKVANQMSAKDLRLGKLSFKEEAAGKLRIFAIADIWTQSLLKPLHDELFRYLERLPNDGTFDQDASYARALEKAKVNNCAFSVDLSSATDRLPIDLQVEILDNLSGIFIGKFWKDLLVSRPYFIDQNQYGIPEGSVLYATGQPMGALSSWAMLAITHHFILQTCAFNVYGTRSWYDNYEILGDDLVIFDRLIYQEYMRLMQLLKVGVNPSKSLICFEGNSLEFAKRTGINGVDVSGISWKQLISEDNLLGRINLIISFSKRGLITSLPMFLRTLAPNRKYSLEIVKSDNTLKTIFENTLMGLLGYLSSDKISLKDAVSVLVDPQLVDIEQLDNPTIPFTKTLHEVIRLLNSKGSSSIKLSQMEFREALLDTEVLPYLMAKVIRSNYERLVKFKEDYFNNGNFHRSLVHTNQYDKLPKEFKAFLFTFSEDIFIGDNTKDMDVLWDEFLYENQWKWDVLLNTGNPTFDDYKELLKFSQRIDNFISSWDFRKPSKATYKENVPWLIKDVIKSRTAYLRKEKSLRDLLSLV